MSDVRDQDVYFGYCGHMHFVLLDVNSPTFQNGPPKAPLHTECFGCGEHFPVVLKEIHRGKVTTSERDHGFTLSQPDAVMMCTICGGEKETLPHSGPFNRFRCKKCGRTDMDGQVTAL